MSSRESEGNPIRWARKLAGQIGSSSFSSLFSIEVEICIFVGYLGLQHLFNNFLCIDIPVSVMQKLETRSPTVALLLARQATKVSIYK